MIELTIKKEYKPLGSIYFEFVGEITEEEAMEFQRQRGFHPSGYGFHEFTYNKGISKWKCSNSCD